MDAAYGLARIAGRGVSCGDGKVLSKNAETMEEWLIIASELGNGQASYELARFYLGRADGYAKAVRYRVKADEQGFTAPVGLRTGR